MKFTFIILFLFLSFSSFAQNYVGAYSVPKEQIISSYFYSTQNDVAIENNPHADGYYLHQNIGNGYYATWSMPLQNIGGSDIYSINSVNGSPVYNRISKLIKLTDDASPSVTRVGAGWLTDLNSASAYKGAYSRTGITGDYVSFTTDSTTSVGCLFYSSSGTGVAKVTIDGDATLANKLLTAQQYVDSGILASSILTTNGGTLNPTDRIYDQFQNSPSNSFVVFGDGLTNKIHTVNVYCTGYKRSAATDVRLYNDGFFSGTNKQLGDSDIVSRSEKDLLTIPSVWEYALNFVPDGATDSSSFHGNSHGYDYQQSFSIKVDGNSISSIPAYSSVHGSSSIVITRTSILRHENLPGVDCANISTTYTIDPHTGLTVNYVLTWFVNGVTGDNPYISMMPLGKNFNRASMVGATKDFTLNHVADTTYDISSDLNYLWELNGVYGAMNWMPHFIKDIAGGKSLILERSDGINKVYVERPKNQPFYIGDVWDVTANYRFNRFPNGSDAALSNKF